MSKTEYALINQSINQQDILNLVRQQFSFPALEPSFLPNGVWKMKNVKKTVTEKTNSSLLFFMEESRA